MKFQNLIYATMVACAFSACSNDDDPNIPDPAQELDATLTVAFSSVGSNGGGLKSLQTKADPDKDANAAIKTIGIAVFNAGAMGTGDAGASGMAKGALISYKTRTLIDSDMDSTACIDAKSGSVDVLVVANPPAGLETLKTKKDFIDATTDAAIKSTELLMSSTVYNVELAKGRNVIVENTQSIKDKFIAKAPVDNFITGHSNIRVFRNVANVQLNKIKVDPRADFGGTKKNATFKLKKVYVMHYLPSVRFFGDADKEWCTVKDGTATITQNEDGATMNKVYNAEKQQEFTYKGTASDVAVTDVPSFFVYDNSSTTKIGDNANVTALVIQGDYTYTANNGVEETSKDAYWTVYINNDTPQAPTTTGSYTGLEHCGVLRNVQYAINATITGPGSPDPENPSAAATLTANVEVVPWGQITLTPDID